MAKETERRHKAEENMKQFQTWLRPFWLFRPRSLARVPAMFAIVPPPGDPRHFRWDLDHWTYFCKVCNKYASDNHIKSKKHRQRTADIGPTGIWRQPRGHCSRPTCRRRRLHRRARRRRHLFRRRAPLMTPCWQSLRFPHCQVGPPPHRPLGVAARGVRPRR